MSIKSASVVDICGNNIMQFHSIIILIITTALYLMEKYYSIVYEL